MTYNQSFLDINTLTNKHLSSLHIDENLKNSISYGNI